MSNRVIDFKQMADDGKTALMVRRHLWAVGLKDLALKGKIKPMFISLMFIAHLYNGREISVHTDDVRELYRINSPYKTFRRLQEIGLIQIIEGRSVRGIYRIRFIYPSYLE